MENKTTNSKAVWSFVLSIIGFFFAGIILGIISNVLATNSMKEIDKEKENGYNLAKAAEIISIIDIIGGVIGAIILLI